MTFLKVLAIDPSVSLKSGRWRTGSGPRSRAGSRIWTQIPLRYGLLASLALAGLSAQARWASPKDVGAVLKTYTVDYDVKKDGTHTDTYSETWLIQTEQGKLRYGQRKLQYNSFTDKIEILEAATLNGKKRVDVPPSAIEDHDKLESHDYDPIKVKSILFPQVHIGSRIVLKYRIVTHTPPVPGQWSLRFDLMPGVMVEHMQLNVTSEKPVQYELHDPENRLRVTAAHRGHRLVATLKKINPGQVVGEKDPFFHPDRFTHLIVTTQASWPKYYASLATDFEKVLSQKLPSEISWRVRDWKKLKTTPERLVAVLEWISKSFRYFGDWRRIRGGFVPRDLKEIDRTRYGDCKDLATLVTAILRHLDIDAHVALIRRGTNPWVHAPEEKTAYLGAFNHAIVRAQKGDHVWWLDATNPVVSLKPYLDIAGKPAWVLNLSQSRFDRTPDVQPRDYVYNDDMDYTFKSKRNVQVRVDGRFDQMAAFDLANNLLTSSVEQTLYSMIDFYSDGQDLVSSKILSKPKVTRRLHDLDLQLQYTTPSISYRTNVGEFLPLHDGVLSGAFYETAHRESDLKISDVPLIHRVHRFLKHVHLLGKPIDCQIKSRWIDLRRQVSVKSGGVEVVQEATVKIPNVRQSEYGSKAFKTLQNQARECFYRTGLVFQTE